MSYLDASGKLRFDAPVSNLNHGSLERGQWDVPLRWPGQHGMYNYPMDQLARRWYERERLEFFCCREILFHGKERRTALRAASMDAVFGVRFTWPYPGVRGERYVFSFLGEAPPQAPGAGMAVNDLEMPDAILVNGACYWQRGFGETLYAAIEVVPAADGPLTITLVKDRLRCMADAHRAGIKTPIPHPVCRGYVHLHLGLQLACEHFGPTERPATTSTAYPLPTGMRRFANPGCWEWVPDETPLPYDYPPVQPPAYPTDGVRYVQFHDIYLDEPDKGGRSLLLSRPGVIRELVRLSLANGIRCFPQQETILQALEAEGLATDPGITLYFSGGYIKRQRGLEEDTWERQHAVRQAEGAELAAVMRRFPLARVVYRLNEFSGCQYCHVVATPEDRARAFPKEWYAFTETADALNREALDDLLTEARALDAARLTVAANVQTGHLAAHPLHCGADFVLQKTIGRAQVNLVIADSRGVNMAFDRQIGLQHDAWGGLNYNRDSAREVEAIYRSFFFNGGEFHDAEFGNYALAVGEDEEEGEGHGAFNLKGMAWIRVTRLAAIHPRRGRQRVGIGFLRGSDSIWGWYYPVSHTMGLGDFDGFDPADPKEFVDFELLNVAFPEQGRWHSPNPERWLTGTPYGPADLVPWDAPATALTRYWVLVMLGANRLEPAWHDRYLDWVQTGGTLVLGLYQLLSPTADRVYLREDFSDLLGLRLGEDRVLWPAFTSLAERQTFVSQHYNAVILAGAEVVERLPNGDPLLLRHCVGAGEVYFFTTDRLRTQPGVAEALLARLFDAVRPVALEPANDRMEIAISEKGDLRIVTLMDHGRDCLPTDAGADTGPYSGTLTLRRDRLGLPPGPLEVRRVIPNATISALRTEPLACRQQGDALQLPIEAMGSWLELVVGPAGTVDHDFFWGGAD